VLEAAAEWGVPPWEIEEHFSYKWYHRWVTLRNMQIAKAKREAKK